MEPLSRITSATVDVLDVLLAGQEPRWGLEIVKATGRASGTVYPILDRLERSGWVTSTWEADSERRGPRRRLYQITGEAAPAARRLLAARAEREAARARAGDPLPQPGT
ncbi:PadR family transcriptional regulator [Microbispora sp. NPDC049125]|uniref:PadR family transcriptional regulator n=1 Tax=Microbispora sp. NPDC049125 TaxID=3154929 RepID=UPI00346786D7